MAAAELGVGPRNNAITELLPWSSGTQKSRSSQSATRVPPLIFLLIIATTTVSSIHVIMANIPTSVLRQASRLAANPVLSSSSRHSVRCLSRVPAASVSRASSRSYVSETKRDNAQVADAKVETAIRLDKKDFEKAGVSLNAQDGSSTSVSPMAGKSFFHHDSSSLFPS